jgi:hypothetical protein
VSAAKNGSSDHVGSIGRQGEFVCDLVDLLHWLIVANFVAQVTDLFDLAVVKFGAFVLEFV